MSIDLSAVDGLVTEVSDGVLTLRLDRPESRNALSIAVRRGIVDAVSAADADPDIRAVVLTGTDPEFCAGVDIAEAMPESGLTPPGSRLDPARTVRGARTPTIAAVNGGCYTGGLELVLACAFVVASERARFADTHAQLGMVSGWGMSAVLPSAVGTRFARRMMLTGEEIDASTAMRVGLVTEVVPHDDLGSRARELAQKVADAHLGAVDATMGVLARGEDAPLDRALELEAEVRATWRTDPADVVRRMRARRDPRR